MRQTGWKQNRRKPTNRDKKILVEFYPLIYFDNLVLSLIIETTTLPLLIYSRGKKTTNNIGSIVLIYFLLSYLSWKKKEHTKKQNSNKQTLALKESTVSTYKIKVRNKQQGTQACRRRQKSLWMKKKDKQKATKR